MDEFPGGDVNPDVDSILERLQGWELEPPETPEAKEQFASELVEYLPDLTFLIATASDFVEGWNLMGSGAVDRLAALKQAVERVVA